MSPSTDIRQLVINTIRTLSMDAVQAANSGHPGTPMALAPVAYKVWQDHMNYDPAGPHWLNRDRFVLSCGHASMLLYSVLHVAQVCDARNPDKPAVPLNDIKNFRQFDSLCPGHPESHLTTGVETTTGPLGQGVANSVGMALAARWLGARFNKPGFDVFNFNTYVICSDGDLMEGISQEAASIAGHLKLSNLCWIYDDNKITIEGETHLAFSDDTAKRFESMGWNVLRVDDANDLNALEKALAAFKADKTGPTLIIVKSHIGFGSPNKQDTHSAHGAPLGDDEIALTKKAYGWTYDKFTVPDGVYDHMAGGLGKRGAAARKAWEEMYRRYETQHPQEARTLDMMLKKELPADWDKNLPTFAADPKGIATRASSGKVLNAVAKAVPWLIGGSADLAPSTNTLLDGETSFLHDNYAGRNLHFGIREHAMGSILNGMALTHLRPYGATFFVFSDYARPTMRLGALMHLPTIYVYTHDSIGVGEDGPTHQPIEHLAALRCIPRLIDFRPGDANEVTQMWRTLMKITDRPCALMLTRQNLPTLDRAKYAPATGLSRGAYILGDAPGGQPEVILIGTGSELSLAVGAYEKLLSEGVAARVVSMPSWALFEMQPREYRDSVLPPGVAARVSVEASSTFGWDRYVGPQGKAIGMADYGASAPLPKLLTQFGFTIEKVAAAAKNLLGVHAGS